MGPMTTKLTSQLVYMIIEFDTGKLSGSSRGLGAKFNPHDIYSLLEPDEALLGQYGSLSFGQQRKQAILFINKFNDRHPISFPVN